MSILDKISKHTPVYRKCPAGRIHKVTADNPDCGHTGQVLEWCEPYQKWVPNPEKTALAKEMLDDDEEFKVEQEARARIMEALRNGDLQPAMDMRRRILSRR